MAYKPSSDKFLFVIANVLAIFGLLMVYSASSVAASAKHDGLSSYYFIRQLIYATIGYGLMVILMNLDYHIWQHKKVIKVLLIVSVLGLLFVLTQPPIHHARRWVRYDWASFQPSEMAKLAIVIYFAAYLHQHEKEINDFKRRLLPCLLVLLLLAGLIAVEPDLGQAVCLILIVAVLLFVAGLRWKFIVTACLVGLPALVLAAILLPNRFERILTFWDRSKNPLSSGWQITQSLTAVGSGGLFGLGLGASKQKLFFLPEAHSDFIFAIVGEELGLIGAVLVCLAFLFFFYRGIRIALKAPDRFGFHLALGITLMVVMQAFINVSMVLGMMPTKGIALPFISQGGSSLLVNLMATGVLLNVSNHMERA